MAHLCCSIEMEPKTLNEGQLSNAREAAVEMVQKMESEEAFNMFNEGLRSIVSIKGMELIDEKSDEFHKQVEFKENAQITEILCECSCTFTNIVDESPDTAKLREPLSAPF